MSKKLVFISSVLCFVFLLNAKIVFADDPSATVSTTNGGTQQNGDLQGQQYQGIAPSGGICSPGWNLETTNGGQTYCAPTQTKCDGDNPGSVLTTDNSGFKVCWQKINNPQQGQQNQPGQFQQFNGGQNFQEGNNGQQPQQGKQPMMGGQNNQNQFGGNNQNQQNRQGQEQMQKRQEQQQSQMLKNTQRGLVQAQKNITNMEKRILAIQKKGGVISQDLTNAFQQAKSLITKGQTATTMDEFQSAGLEDMQDIMETINDGMQKAEMSTQFPAMLKQASKIIAQQKKSLASAQKRSSSLKIDLSSLITKWQTAIDGVSQSITQAQQDFQASNIEDAVTALKDNVFDVSQDMHTYQQTFDMVSNSQKMLTNATKELVSIEKRIAALKKQGKDTGDAESVLADSKSKIQIVKDSITKPDIDPDTLMEAIQNIQDSKDELYSAMYDLTGLKQYNIQTQQTVPWLEVQQFQAPQGMQQYFGGFSQQPQNGQGEQRNMQQPSNRPSENQNNNFQQMPGGENNSQSSGSQGLNTNSSSVATASVFDSILNLFKIK